MREHGSRLRARAHARVRIGAFRQQQLDVLEVVHVGLASRIVAALDVAVVRRDVQRAPAAFVLDVRIGAAFEEEFAELVMTVLRGREQRCEAELRRLIDVGAGIEQQLCRREIAFARREHERRQAAGVAGRGGARVAGRRRQRRLPRSVPSALRRRLWSVLRGRRCRKRRCRARPARCAGDPTARDRAGVRPAPDPSAATRRLRARAVRRRRPRCDTRRPT